MTKFTNLVAVAALTTVGAAPALAQEADPFLSTQSSAVGAMGLSQAAVAAVVVGVVASVALVVNDDGSVSSTTTTTTGLFK